MQKNKSIFKQVLDQMVRLLITGSGYITSITILLIILFLFRDTNALFHQKQVEEGHTILIHQSNPVTDLPPETIMKLFDRDVIDWDQVSDFQAPVFVYRYQQAAASTPSLEELFNQHPGIIALVPNQVELPNNAHVLNLGNVTPSDFLTNPFWFPTITPVAQFGLLPLLLGTLWVSIFAILFALPFSLAISIFMAELASKRVRKLFKPIIELLAGIPSVVYGFFGLVVLVPAIQKLLNLPVGETAFTGSIILAIMAIPTIVTIAEDALRSTPVSMKEASLALGATRWQTIRKVVLPYAKSGVASAVVLGVGRAIGETMAVLMVTGNAAVIPHSLFEPVRTIPATIAAELGEAPVGSAHYEALFGLGAVLFLITLALSVLVDKISKSKY